MLLSINAAIAYSVNIFQLTKKVFTLFRLAHNDKALTHQRGKHVGIETTLYTWCLKNRYFLQKCPPTRFAALWVATTAHRRKIPNKKHTSLRIFETISKTISNMKLPNGKKDLELALRTIVNVNQRTNMTFHGIIFLNMSMRLTSHHLNLRSKIQILIQQNQKKN